MVARRWKSRKFVLPGSRPRYCASRKGSFSGTASDRGDEVGNEATAISLIHVHTFMRAVPVPAWLSFLSGVSLLGTCHFRAVSAASGEAMRSIERIRELCLKTRRMTSKMLVALSASGS